MSHFSFSHPVLNPLGELSAISMKLKIVVCKVFQFRRVQNVSFVDVFIWSSLKNCQTTNLDSSRLKEFADDNFKFHENGSKLSKRVENTVGKGEIAHDEQFLLFPQCFQKSCFPRLNRCYCVGIG